MSYFYLTRLLKERINGELVDYFAEHPEYNKITISDKFSYKNRPQYGIILRNSSGSQIHLAADNFKGEFYSHVSLFKLHNKPGKSVEWAKENQGGIFYEKKEDVSSQIDGYTRTFTVSHTIILDDIDHHPLRKDIAVVVTYPDGSQRNLEIQSIGEKTVTLFESIPLGYELEVIYVVKNMAEEGFYYIEITDKDEYIVAPLLRKKELLVERATGAETSFDLSFTPLEESEFVNYGESSSLVRNEDYKIEDNKLILLNSLESSLSLNIDYLVPDEIQGPFKITGSIDSPVRGVDVFFASNPIIGDKMAIHVAEERMRIGRQLGGRWEMSISMDVFSRDSLQREEITDLLLMFWGFKKEQFDAEGIYFKEMNYGGETEEMYDEEAQEPYFISSVDMTFDVVWEIVQPYPKILRAIQVNEKLFPKTIIRSTEILGEKVG